jgi:predicted dithiol-disulfide oxidoreductase (DUF899 family)
VASIARTDSFSDDGRAIAATSRDQIDRRRRGDRQMMYGPHRREPCPMCSSFLSSWNGTAVNLRERVAIAVTARSPIDRLVDYKKHRGLANLPFVSDMSGEYTRTYVNPEDADVPGFSVFSRRDGIIRHFYTGEMSSAMDGQ